MSNISIPTLINQLPYAQTVFNAELLQPQMQQVLAGQFALQKLQKEHSKIQKAEESAESKKVKGEKEDGGSGQAFQHAMSQQHEAPTEDGAESTSQFAAPWAGNIVNLRI
ncbi:hypothetical protein [Desulfovibrio inopinatus]|uniref:hypothetical protein n=1 Tax=Desulfovibrio inopinatus TaxID=102109 RepID=UPI000417F600|nr:hypothetical protein [Desulfovibrio inopinatus]